MARYQADLKQALAAKAAAGGLIIVPARMPSPPPPPPTPPRAPRPPAIPTGAPTLATAKAAEKLSRIAHVDVSKETLRQLVEAEGKNVLEQMRRGNLVPE